MKRFAFILIVVAVSLSAHAQKPSGTTFAYDALKPYVESGQLPGAISVFYDDGIQETCCIGYSDPRTKRPIKMNDPFMQCSQTKSFCGVTVAKLVEEGKLNLDDPVSKYLPEFKTLWVLDDEDENVHILRKAQHELTVRMCLNHMGGFPFEISAKRNDVRGGGWSGGAPLRQTASIAAASPILFEPGTAVRYSNTGIDIAAAVVEVVTGMKWEDYLKETVLDPLGMKSTCFRPSNKLLKHRIMLFVSFEDAPAKYVEENSNQQQPYNDAHVFASAGAGLWTTAADQLKYYKMLMNLGVGENGVRILKEETVKELLAVSSRPKGSGGYSLGLSAPEEDSESSWFGHGGAFGTSAEVNWHTKQLKLWVVQKSGGPNPWGASVAKAAEQFFQSAAQNSGVADYTGRIK